MLGEYVALRGSGLDRSQAPTLNYSEVGGVGCGVVGDLGVPVVGVAFPGLVVAGGVEPGLATSHDPFRDEIVDELPLVVVRLFLVNADRFHRAGAGHSPSQPPARSPFSAKDCGRVCGFSPSTEPPRAQLATLVASRTFRRLQAKLSK